MTKAEFYKGWCPKTRKEFIAKFRDSYVFRYWANEFGFRVIGESVLFPDGQFIANPIVK